MTPLISPDIVQNDQSDTFNLPLYFILGACSTFMIFLLLVNLPLLKRKIVAAQFDKALEELPEQLSAQIDHLFTDLNYKCAISREILVNAVSLPGSAPGTKHYFERGQIFQAIRTNPRHPFQQGTFITPYSLTREEEFSE